MAIIIIGFVNIQRSQVRVRINDKNDIIELNEISRME